MLIGRSTRTSLLAVLRSAAAPRIVFATAAMLAYVGAEVWVGSALGLWNRHLISDTIWWLVFSGAALFFSLGKATQPGYIRSTARKLIGAAVVVEFFANLYVFRLPVEIGLQVMVLLLVGMTSVAANQPEHHQTKAVLDWILRMLGAIVLAYVAYEAARHWRDLGSVDLLRQFLLPMWMAASALPFVYLLALTAYYRRAFGGINWATADGRRRRRSKAALLCAVGWRVSAVADFNWGRCRQLTETETFKEAYEFVRTIGKSGKSVSATTSPE